MDKDDPEYLATLSLLYHKTNNVSSLPAALKKLYRADTEQKYRSLYVAIATERRLSPRT